MVDLILPGKCAKYCTYVMSTLRQRYCKGKGLQTFFSKLNRNFTAEWVSDKLESDKVTTIATDRNKQLAEWLHEKKPSMKHCYDPWHFAKNIKKQSLDHWLEKSVAKF